MKSEGNHGSEIQERALEEEGGEVIVEPLTVFRGTTWVNSFDGQDWHDARATEDNPDIQKFTFGKLVEMEAASRVDAKRHQSQTTVSPDNGTWVDFKDKNSSQAIRFNEAVVKRAKELIEES